MSTDPPLSGYLTSEEAAAALGVKRATLYTYVSRGMVRIAPVKDGRHRMYLASDVQALQRRTAAARGEAPVAAAALDWGLPVMESAITSIDVDGPNYRGVPALTLVERGTAFESTAELLWSGVEPAHPPRFEADGLGVETSALATVVPAGTKPHAALSVLVAALGAADPLRHAVTDVAELSRARRLLRRMAAGLALGGARKGIDKRIGAAMKAPTIPGAILVALDAPARAADLVRRALVVCADHELNASTFAARVAAGTGADLYACVTAALATLSGPRHGGLCDRVEAMVDDAVDAPDVRVWLGERFRRGEPIPGFGHRLYPEGDPRGRALLQAAVASDGGPRLEALEGIVAGMREAGHPPPTLDIGLVAICTAARLPHGSAAGLFAVGRCAGWVAHSREQRASGRMLRPRARYVGP